MTQAQPSSQPTVPSNAHLVDLNRQLDVDYWCNVFDVTHEQLRVAVHNVGPIDVNVQRYLAEHHLGRSGGTGPDVPGGKGPGSSPDAPSGTPARA